MTRLQYADICHSRKIQFSDPFQAIVPMFPPTCGAMDCSPRMPLYWVRFAIARYLHLSGES